jgi:multiple sugar transport system substrate-binding protein
MFKALKEKGTPGGMALGHATGDAGRTQWLMWAFGGKLVDANNKVVINSPETLKALDYGKELYATFIPGTLSWLDPNNNKAFLDGQISITNNGISVTTRRRIQLIQRFKEGGCIQHASFPIGPVGVPTEYHLFFNQMVMKRLKHPRRQGIHPIHDGAGAV